jgi:hypothetical protein
MLCGGSRILDGFEISAGARYARSVNTHPPVGSDRGDEFALGARHRTAIAHRGDQHRDRLGQCGCSGIAEEW